MNTQAGASPASDTRRNHKHRGTKTKDLDHRTLVRDAHKILEASGAHQSPSWVSRAVRDFERSPLNGMPFGMFLASCVQMHAARRTKAEANHLDAREITYADPTGETAIRNVKKQRGH